MRRRWFAAACGALATTGLAGCLGDATDIPGADGTPPSRDETDGTPTADPPDAEYPVDEPDPDLGVFLENDDDAAHSVAITVTRSSGETVYEETHDAAPDTDREVYNLQRADPDGVESFEIAATTGERSDAVTVETNACHGNAIVAVDEDGELFVTYSIC